MNKRRILIISGIRIFPPESGGQLRTAALAESLADIGHDVIIYSFTGRKSDYLQQKHTYHTRINDKIIEIVNMSLINGLLQFLSYKLSLPPIWITIATSIHVDNILKSAINNCNQVIIDFPFLHPLVKYSNKVNILNTHNVERDLWTGNTLKNRTLRYLVKNIELKAIHKAPWCLFATSLDRNKFATFFPYLSGKSFVIPNGLNIKRIRSNIEKSQRDGIRKSLGITPTTKLILFSGSSYSPNLDALIYLKSFCTKNSDLLSELDIKFLILGSVSDKAMNSEFYYATSRVEDPYIYFSAADAAINPVTFGSGSNIKMNEYIAFKLPIITTSFGARGFTLVGNFSSFLFERDYLNEALISFVHECEYGNVHAMAERAYLANKSFLEMSHNVCQCPLFT